jgi:hypothetical protein
MTIQDLKNNRNEIIEFITSNYSNGKVYLQEVMEEMVSNINYTEKETVLAFAKGICEDFNLVRSTKVVKESKLAAMVASAHEGETFNTFTKEWN